MANKKRKKILIRVDGSKRIGMGHIYRTITLANYLKKHFGFEIVFVSRNVVASRKLIMKNDFAVHFLPFNISKVKEMITLKGILDIERPDFVIVDLLNHVLDISYMRRLRYNEKVSLIAFVDRHTKTPVDADIVFNTSVFQKEHYYKTDRHTRYYLGFNYLILPEEYLDFKVRKKILGKSVKHIMICMGGADHHNLTFKILKAIDQSRFKYECNIVLNSDFIDRSVLDRLMVNMQHKINVHYNVKNLVKLLRRADVAITAGGYTHVERMCAGVPGIVINQLLHQAKLSNWIMGQGGTLDLGLHKSVAAANILSSFDELICDYDLRKAMSKRGRQLVSGQGLKNISRVITKCS